VLGERGPFDREAHGSSIQVELDLHRGWIALAGGIIGAAIVAKKLAA
jgi:hypothetical protein